MGLAHHGLFDRLANAVGEREVDLLDDRRVVAGCDQKMIAEQTKPLASAARHSDCDDPALPRRCQRGQDIGRAARSRKRKQCVTAPAQTCDLPREHLSKP